MIVDPEDPLAMAVTQAIRTGDLEGLRRLLEANPGLATARLGHDRPGGETRSLLHVATDWPGHFPNGAATLGLLDRLEAYFAGAAPAADEVTRASWGACHGGQRACAEYLLDRGADIDWVPPWEPLTPLDAAARSGADDLVAWLRSRGARPAAELPA